MEYIFNQNTARPNREGQINTITLLVYSKQCIATSETVTRIHAVDCFFGKAPKSSQSNFTKALHPSVSFASCDNSDAMIKYSIKHFSYFPFYQPPHPPCPIDVVSSSYCDARCGIHTHTIHKILHEMEAMASLQIQYISPMGMLSSLADKQRVAMRLTAFESIPVLLSPFSTTIHGNSVRHTKSIRSIWIL